MRALVLSSVCDVHRSLSSNGTTSPTMMSCASRGTTKRNIFHSHLNPEEFCVLQTQVPSPPVSSDCSFSQYSSANPPLFNSHFVLANKTLLGLIILSSLSSGKCIWIKGHSLNCLLSHKYFYQRKISRIQLCVLKMQNSKKFYCQTFTPQ